MSFSRLNTHAESGVYAPIKVLETGRLQTKHWEQRKTYLTCVECVPRVDATSKHPKATTDFDEGLVLFFPFKLTIETNGSHVFGVEPGV